jgi:hypothetical protein
VHLTDLGAQKSGTHDVRVDWQGTCGPNAPSATVAEGAKYEVVIRPARAGRRPVVAKSNAIEATSGSETIELDPGRRIFARITLACEDSVPGPTPDDDPTIESASAKAESPETIYAPPRLLGYHDSRASYCGNVTARQRATGIGAADFETIEWQLSFGATSMLQHPSVTGILKEVRLRASGKGMRVRIGPASGPLRKYQSFQATIFSPRSGRVKIWAEIGGVKTNSLTIPIYGKPCVRDPWRYYGAAVMRGANPFIRG